MAHFRNAPPWLGALALIGLAAAVAALMDQFLSLANLVMVFLLAVVALAVLHGRSAGVWGSALAVLVFDFLFVPPRYTIVVESAEYLVTLGVMLTVSLLIGGLAARLRTETDQARRGERQALALHALGERLGRQSETKPILQDALALVTDEFKRPGAIVRLDRNGRPAEYIRTSVDGPAEFLNPDAAVWAARERRMIGWRCDDWPDLPAVYVPIAANSPASAVLVLAAEPHSPSSLNSPNSPDTPLLDHAAIRFLDTLARQVALAVDRAQFEDRARRAAIDTEIATTRGALLAAVSHDMRTPLAAILGAATTLQSLDAHLDPSRREALLAIVASEASNVSRTTNDMLQLARLTSGVAVLEANWESAEEIVGTVVERFRRGTGDISILVDIPLNLPLIRVDPTLIAHALGNLLENALKHGRAPIELMVRHSDTHTSFIVLDHGDGFDPAINEHLFEAFVRGKGSARRAGAGLGLAICRLVAQAHGGSVEAVNRSEGGARFSLHIPQLEPPPQIDDLVERDRRSVS